MVNLEKRVAVGVCGDVAVGCCFDDYGDRRRQWWVRCGYFDSAASDGADSEDSNEKSTYPCRASRVSPPDDACCPCRAIRLMS